MFSIFSAITWRHSLVVGEVTVPIESTDQWDLLHPKWKIATVSKIHLECYSNE
jgi:hypothetical protein